jgi:hypothetical protein
VLTISMHEHPATLFPGTGFPSEAGGPGAEGSAVNLALPAGTRDAGWLRGFHAVVPPPLRESHLLFEAAGCPLDADARVPGLWREYVGSVTGQAAPELMTEGGIAHHVPFEDGYDPGESVDRAIMATRKAVFPLHGLAPGPPRCWPESRQAEWPASPGQRSCRAEDVEP